MSCCSTQKSCCASKCKSCFCWLFTTVIVGLFLAGFCYVFHCVLMDPLYEDVPDLIRSKESMSELGFVSWLLIGLKAFAAVLLFGCTGKRCGIGFGLCLGFLFAVLGLMSYVWMPISLSLAGFWALGGFLEGLGIGLILALFCRKKKGCCGGKKDKCCKPKDACCDTPKPVAFGEKDGKCCSSETPASHEKKDGHGCCSTN